MSRRSLLFKILLMFAGVLLFLGIFVTASIWKLSQKAVSTQVQKDVQHASLAVKSYVDQARQEVQLQALLVAQQPSLRAIIADSRVDVATLKDSLKEYQLMVKADGLAFFDRDGKSKVQLGVAPSTKSLSNSALDSLLSKNQDRLNGFERGRDGLLLSVTVPIRIGALPLGFVTAYRKIDNVIAKSLGNSLGIEVAFQFQDAIAASSIDGQGKIGLSPNMKLTTINGRSYGSQSFSLVEDASHQKIDVIILRSESEATVAYRQLFKVFMILMPIALVIAIGLSGIFARSLVASLRTVVAAAEELSAGRWPDKLEVNSRDEVGILQQVFNTTVDSLRSAQERLMAMIDLDPLTELHNHRYFKEALISEVERSNANHEDLALVLIDLDGFKKYNETNGLSAGDQALRDVARIIRDNTEAYDHTARFGGNEFAILLPGNEAAEAEACAEAIRQEVKVCLPGLTVSIGSAQYGINTSRGEGLKIAAELALARAKQLGRDRVCRFENVPGAEGDVDPYQLYKYMQDASLATIQALAAAVDAKDAYTKGHSTRVAEYARDLAQYLGLKESVQELTYRTGTLHDVGKIGVPDSILNKPSRLEDEERAIMETHPVLGELIVRKAPQLEDTIPGVRHHHEAWDGTGYPDRLSGEDIPLIARLLAVADTYDAMTSDRPYRKGMAVDFALSTIRKGAGTQFDPELALAFVDMMESALGKNLVA